MIQASLFDVYPNSPGYRREGPSRAAADAVKPRAVTLRDMVYALLKREALTADQCAERLGKERHNVRSRCSELFAQGLIRKLDLTRPNRSSGLQAHVWKAIA